ncbi:MAG: hypothetical protein Q8P95_05595 [bacterium]|nr:hypothetical protein [bacterium]
MSTLRNNITAKRIALLAAKDEKVFHSHDLANMWNISSHNTLRTTLKRYARQGLLHRIYRGMYSLVPLEGVDPSLLGAKAIHSYCYVSIQTILFREGYQNQPSSSLTFISSKSRKFNLGPNYYSCRQLRPNFLFNTAGIIQQSGVNTATVERAIADLLYFNPHAYFDKEPDWKKVRQLQQEIGYPLTP